MATTHAPQRVRPRAAMRRTRVRRAGFYVLGGLVAIALVAWIGLRVEPRPLPDAGLAPGNVATMPVPEGLPPPVARFYETLYGDEIPIVETAVIAGRGRLRINGITFPARYRFTHIAGQDYRHYIEVTVFGARLLAVNEWFLDGQARLELPFGVFEGPQVDQGANLALWAESGWLPSVWLTDPRVEWEAVDATSARLHVPFGDERESFVFTFDPATGLLRTMEAMRYKGETAEADKILWINEATEWGEVDGWPAPLRTTVTWADEGSPWARFRTEEVIYNADLGDYIRGEGP